MDTTIVLSLIIIIILILTRTNNISNRLLSIEKELKDLRLRLKQQSPPQPGERPKAARPAPSPREDWWVPDPTVPPPVPKPETPRPVQEEVPVAPKPQTPIPPPPAIAPPTVKERAYVPPPPPKPGFFERNPDLEKFIGENLVSKIGIAILVIGIAFFVKFAIDSHWIGEVGRVCIGILCGGILIALAHRLQKNYHAFSSVLVGGGIAVFYFTIALAYREYELFSQPVAFSIMVVITIMAILLSLLYDRQEVAIIAITGGFAVPFMVSNGSGNYIVLFMYLLILNAGILVIAYRKGWRLLNALAFVFTILLFGGWLTSISIFPPLHLPLNGFLFATAFYLLFLGANIAHNIREQRKFIASDFGILLANTSLYFLAGLYLLYLGHIDQYKGLFSACMAVLNLALSYWLFRNQRADKNVLYLLIGITLTFVSITAPLQLHGHFITIFWASETVVLWWLYRQSGIRLLQIAFVAVWIATLISLAIDWGNVYDYHINLLTIIANRAAMTTIYVIGSQLLLYRLARKAQGDEGGPVYWMQPFVFLVVAMVIGFVGGELEVYYQFSTRFPGSGLTILYVPLHAVAYLLAMYALLHKRLRDEKWALALPLLLGGALFIYLVSLARQVGFQQESIILHKYGGHIVAHWLLTIGGVFAFYRLCMIARQSKDGMIRGTAAWAGAAIATTIVSTEIYMLINAIAGHDPMSLAKISRIYVRVGLPIVWGLCSFILMYFGFKYKERTLRIIALTLFGITLLKLFLFDIRNIAPAGKIAAFFCLGILLLVVSFMYQRLRKIIVDDAEKNKKVDE